MFNPMISKHDGITEYIADNALCSSLKVYGRGFTGLLFPKYQGDLHNGIIFFLNLKIFSFQACEHILKIK